MTGLLDTASGALLSFAGAATDDDIARINALDNPPPVRVTAEDVYIRRCRLTGDGINCHFGRFRTNDLPMLLEKVQGVSCLIGHRKDTAGIARFFSGSIETFPAPDLDTGRTVDMRFIVPKIYWMKRHSGAEDLRENIDGGVYHQASISWLFERPVCGICGKDIRECDHVPGKRYGGKLCFFWYDGIGDVLEGSIVYAGGHPGTGFSVNDSVRAVVSQAAIYKMDDGGTVRRDDLQRFLPEEEPVRLAGRLAAEGWTDDCIEVSCSPDLFERAAGLFPPFLSRRLVHVQESEDECINMKQLTRGTTDAPVSKNGSSTEAARESQLDNTLREAIINSHSTENAVDPAIDSGCSGFSAADNGPEILLRYTADGVPVRTAIPTAAFADDAAGIWYPCSVERPAANGESGDRRIVDAGGVRGSEQSLRARRRRVRGQANKRTVRPQENGIRRFRAVVAPPGVR